MRHAILSPTIPQSGNCYLCTQFIVHNKLPTCSLRFLLLGYSISVWTRAKVMTAEARAFSKRPVAHLGCGRIHKVHFCFLSHGCFCLSLFSRDCEIASSPFKISSILSCFRINLEKNFQTTCKTWTEHFSCFSIEQRGICIFLSLAILKNIRPLFLVWI